MACDIATLLSQACDNSFMQVAQDETLSRAIILQLFSDASGGGLSEAELYEQACDNGFVSVAQNAAQFRAVLLQLLCEIGGD